MRRLLIWGAGDQGFVMMDCALAMNRYNRIDFLAIEEKGQRILPFFIVYKEKEVNIKELMNDYDEVIVATGDNDLREVLIKRLNDMNVPLALLIHPSAIISPFAKLSKGCYIGAHVVINTNATIGIGCIVNTGAMIEHDCIIKDYVNISPGVAIAGHTIIGMNTFLGIGCTIINHRRIGDHVVVGGGTVVIRDISDGSVVAGVPSKSIR